MQKPQLLRNYLIKNLPKLATNPEQLLIFVENGKILSPSGGSLSFAYQYKLNLIVLEWTDSVDQLLVLISAWLHVYEPPTADAFVEALSFEIEYLSNNSCDISFDIKLTERLKITHDTKGFVTEHLDDRLDTEFIAPWVQQLQQAID